MTKSLDLTRLYIKRPTDFARRMRWYKARQFTYRAIIIIGTSAVLFALFGLAAWLAVEIVFNA